MHTGCGTCFVGRTHANMSLTSVRGWWWNPDFIVYSFTSANDIVNVATAVCRSLNYNNLPNILCETENLIWRHRCRCRRHSFTMSHVTSKNDETWEGSNRISTVYCVVVVWLKAHNSHNIQRALSRFLFHVFYANSKASYHCITDGCRGCQFGL